MAREKETDIQIKFTVDEEQKRRLDLLAKQRELSVPQYAKLTALGVRIKPAPIINILEDDSETKELLKEILQHLKVNDDGSETLFISSKFEPELIIRAKKYLQK